MKPILSVVLATVATTVATAVAAQDWRYDESTTRGADSSWWDGHPRDADAEWRSNDRFDWTEQEEADALRRQEWGRGASDWDYLDEYNYYQDADPTDNLPRVDPDLWAEQYQNQLDPHEPEVWSEPESLDDLTTVPPAEDPTAQPGEPFRADPGLAVPTTPERYRDDYEVDIEQRDDFDTWYSEKSHQRFYDSLSL